MLIRKLTYTLVLIAASILVFTYFSQKPPYLSFSDAAKFADVARNLVKGLGYGSSFAYSGSVGQTLRFPFAVPWTPPLTVFSMAVAFKIFGVSDVSVVMTSAFFYVLSVLFTYLLGRKLFGNLAGALGAAAVAANPDILNYATSGASESPFILEIVSSAYFFTLKKRWATIVGFILLVLMYFTRPQAFIYIAGLILFYLLSRFKKKKAILYFLGVGFFGFLIDRLVLLHFAGRYFIYSVTGSGLNVVSQYNSGVAVSDALRGNIITSTSFLTIFKKVFYNLYNFYRLIPQIMSPYLFGLFIISLFRWTKDRIYNSFKIAVIFMVFITFLVTALSIPFFRYLHPVLPLVYIFAVDTLVWIVHKVVGDWCLVASGKLKSQITSHKLLITIIASTFLIFVFGVGQTLGVIFLDSRFERNTHNVGKPPIYVVLSRILKDNTMPDQVIVTNLDTWGSWYGQRRTVWFPLEPKHLIDPATGKIPFDAIYLTSYLIDDENYYMGNDWREIFNNPNDPKKWTCEGCQEIATEFSLRGSYSVPPYEDYERQDVNSVLLVRKFTSP